MIQLLCNTTRLIFVLSSLLFFSITLASTVPYQQTLDRAYALYQNNQAGQEANYIPQLAKASPNNFAIVLVTTQGAIYQAGDINKSFPIESIAKIFIASYVMHLLGAQELLQKIGANATGMRFNSIVAMQMANSKTGNPLVNAGAIATSSFIPGHNQQQAWDKIHTSMEGFAGSPLLLNHAVFASEQDTNYTNRAITLLLYQSKQLHSDPNRALYLYTKACSLNVTTRQLAIMGATLANHGVNPITHHRQVERVLVPKLLALMAIEGMYDNSGNWLYQSNVVAKSGVGGGMIAVVPGKFAIAVYSPRLDKYGNSVRGQLVIQYIIKTLHAGLFA